MNDMIKIEKDMTPKLIGDTYMKYPTEISPKGIGMVYTSVNIVVKSLKL